jgi:hypothetical protein
VVAVVGAALAVSGAGAAGVVVGVAAVVVAVVVVGVVAGARAFTVAIAACLSPCGTGAQCSLAFVDCMPPVWGCATSVWL